MLDKATIAVLMLSLMNPLGNTARRFNAMKRKIHGCLCLLLFIACVTTRAAVLSIEEKPRGQDNFSVAQFRLWLPEGVKTVGGVMVLLPGIDCDSQGLIDDPQWQKLALELGFGLLGCHFKEGKNRQRYDLADRGSGKALLKSLLVFAKAAGAPSLENAPLAFWAVGRAASLPTASPVGNRTVC